MAEREKDKKRSPAGKSAPSGPLSLLHNLLYSSSNVIGIDIGSAYLKILQLQKSGKRYSVRNAVTSAFPQPARENPAEKSRFVRELVGKFLAEARVKTKLVRVALSGKNIFIFSLNVPQLNKKDLRGAVAIELKKRLPTKLDINNVSFDYFLTGQAQEEKGAMLQATCIAADRSAIDEQIQQLKELGLTPVGVFTVPDCLGSLMPNCFEPLPKSSVALLDIGASVSQLNFYRGQNLVFSRDIPIGGDHFTLAMSRELVTSAGPVVISAEEAEKLKRNWGIPLDEEVHAELITDFGQFRGEQIVTMLRPVLERLVMEISRTMQYYVKTFKSEQIVELYLTGGLSRLKNIDKFLQSNVEGVQKVQPLNVLKSVKGWSERLHAQELVMEQAAPHLAVAFGLCLGTGGRVNLLPMKEKIEQKANLASTLLKFAFPAVALLNIVLYVLIYFNGMRYQAFASRLAAEMHRLEPSAQKIRAYRQQKERLEQKKQLLEKAKGKQPRWLELMKELSNIIPETIAISRISTEGEKNSLRLRLSGTVYPPQYTVADLALSQFIMALEESPYFRQVELVVSKKNVFSPIVSSEFEILCGLNY